ncbi:MAG: 4-(cytidine 5'-diphospho)-2-C-methyl-D-erythritol kinase [Paracoccaceae bacterium]|nr:4-(cytidine 5'-diphospho)-2-C-methyl-D-erythritol kinase [Paracoccaceae bacterium]
MTAIEVFTPAKINLTLHVTGQREDGYHLLDSLVAFASVGDRLRIVPGNALSLTVEGREAAGVPADMDNLALRAAALIRGDGAALTLDKNLPSASGIGGGSADAAAAWRGMFSLDEQQAKQLCAAPDAVLDTHLDALLGLGADVPMCLISTPLRVRGIGDQLTRVALPSVPAILVNPRVPVSTPAVFQALEAKPNPPMPDDLPDFADAATLIDWLHQMRNDLQAPAIAVEPAISAVLDAIAALPGCRLARMSGSGATCFGLFETWDEATAAAQVIHTLHPPWWLAACVLGDQWSAAMPRVS